MPMNVTADPRFFSLPQAGARLPQIRVRSAARRTFLIFVSITFSLGALAVFEPSPSDIAILFLFAAGLLAGNLRWHKQLTLPVVLLAVFVVANLVSLCYAIDLNQAALYFGITAFMLVLWFFVIGVITRFEERGANLLMLGFTFGGVASALIALLAYFGLAPLGDWVLFYDRIKGFFKDPNVFGPYLVMVAVYALHRVLNSKGAWQKLPWAASSIIASLGVLLCYSRAAWINYAVTLVIFFGLTIFVIRESRARLRNLLYFTLLVLVIAAAIAYAMTIPQVSEVISYRAEMQHYDADRFATFQAAIQLGLNNPLGVGPAQSFLLLDYATHNVYLRVFSENGFIGFLSFTALGVITLVRSTLLSQRAAGSVQRSLFAVVSAALVGTFVNSFTIDTLHWRHFWVLLALAWMPLWKKQVPQPGPSRTRLEPLAQS